MVVALPMWLAEEQVCSIFVRMAPLVPSPLSPPRCVTAEVLGRSRVGARLAVAGLVVCRQRPGTAKNVTFVTLEDETGTANVVVWSRVFERYRRAVVAGRCLRVTGRVQREGIVVHLVAERIEDISAVLDEIVL